MRACSKLYRKIENVSMGTYCAPLVADLFLFCYDRGIILSLSYNNQAGVTALSGCYCGDPERGGRGFGPPPPLKSFSNTGPDPLKNHKATKPALNAGPSSACQ